MKPKHYLQTSKKKTWDANHHCFAYVLSGHQKLERYGDDGEPAGTAGMPILEVLRGSELENVLAVVIRYFGGTKLGTGGLVRAYTKATQDVISEATIIEKGTYIEYDVDVAYTLSGKVEYYIQTENLLLQSTDYGEGVTYKMVCPKPRYDIEVGSLIELCNNNIVIKKNDEHIGYIEEGNLIKNLC